MGKIALGASIAVQPLILNFKPDKRYQDVSVFNTSKETAYVTVRLFKAKSLQSPHHWVQLQGAPRKFGLIVSQNKLVIPPAQVRTVRVLEVGNIPHTKQKFMLNFAPVTGQLETVHVTGKHVLAGVRVVVSYNVIANIG